MMLRFRERFACGGMMRSSWESVMEAPERFVEFRELRDFICGWFPLPTMATLVVGESGMPNAKSHVLMLGLGGGAVPFGEGGGGMLDLVWGGIEVVPFLQERVLVRWSIEGGRGCG
jgi:hypothetical protein